MKNGAGMLLAGAIGLGLACEGPPGGLPAGLDERPVNATCLAPQPPPSQVALERVFAAVPAEFPVAMLQDPSGDWLLADRSGAIYRFPDEPDADAGDVDVALDLRAAVGDPGGEGGMLGLALHPSFETRAELFVSYMDGAASRIVRFRSSDGGVSFDADAGELVLELEQPTNIHNGGHITFGPDGYLYAAFGDGGLPGGDPENHAQNTGNLYGSIVRLDVDGPSPYGIPPDNPLVEVDGARPEIFAYGFRNPWRFQHDGSGDLWLGDVGHGQREEIDRVVAGGNYGWPIKEGTHCFRGPCPPDGLIDPVFEYHHGDEGDRSVTGGFVYRGDDLVRHSGQYLFADWTSGRIWKLVDEGDDYGRTELASTGLNIASFAQDRDGELYVLTARPGGIHRLVPGGGGTELPESLAATGCVDPASPDRPASGLIPYDVAVPFWSDGADKERYLALPDGATIAVDEWGDWTLPPGAVTMKVFRRDGRLIETRFFVRHDDGSYSGYTYEWDPSQTNATLVEDAARKLVAGADWIFPGAGGCMSCHTAAAGRSLGLETRQMDIDVEYEQTGRTANQIHTLRAIGVLDRPDVRDPLPAADDDEAPIRARARAYLHVNCAGCHQPDGPARGDLDLRYDVDFADTGLCDRPPTVDDLGVPDARLLAPGDPARSLVYLRMTRRDEHGMPPLASVLPDETGADLIAAWIDGLTSCP